MAPLPFGRDLRLPPAASRVALALGGGLTLALALAELVRPGATVPLIERLDPSGAGGLPFVGRAKTAGLGLLVLGALVFTAMRLAGRRIAFASGVVLLSTPAWFVHARLTTERMIPLAAASFVFAGLGLALLEQPSEPAVGAGKALVEGDPGSLDGPLRRVTTPVAASLVARGVGGALAIGGAALGHLAHALVLVVAPAAVGVGIAAARSGKQLNERRRRTTAGGWGASPKYLRWPGVLVAIVGVGVGGFGVVRQPPPHATFDSALAAFVYGLVPWSPLAALAFGRRMRAPFHVAATVSVVAMLVLQVFTDAGPKPSTFFLGLAPAAVAIAFALDALDDGDATRRGRPGVLAPLVILVLAMLVAHDIELEPDRVAAAALGVAPGTIAPPHLAAATRLTRFVIGASAAAFTLVSILPARALPARRSLVFVVVVAIAGLVLRVQAFPRILASLSPGTAVEAYGRARNDGDALATFRIDRREAVVFPASASFLGPTEAAAWLDAAPIPARRFVALPSAELPRLNAAFRAIRGTNLPVLAGGESLVFLATSKLREHEASENALDRIVLAEPPASLAHPLDAVLGDRVDVLGWDLAGDPSRRGGSEQGAALPSLPSSRAGHLRVYLRLRHGASPLDGFCTFIHVDHTPTRFGLEHRTHPYPMPLWRPGDVIVDDFAISLPPAFRTGSYPLYFGIGVLPCEDDRRLPITHGPNDGHHRLPAGRLEVR